MKLKLTSLKNNYYLILKWNYCGAVVESKTPRVGEDWLRGNDLGDGKLWKLPLILWDNCSAIAGDSVNLKNE